MDFGKIDELFSTSNDNENGERPASNPGISPTEDPVAWIRNVLSENEEFTFYPTGENRWSAHENQLGKPVTTTVSLVDGIVEVEASVPIGVNEENVAALRAFQMLRQANYKIRGFRRAMPGEPFASIARHVVTDDLDLDRLITVTNHTLCSSLRDAIDIRNGEKSVHDVWLENTKRRMKFAFMSELFTSDSD